MKVKSSVNKVVMSGLIGISLVGFGSGVVEASSYPEIVKDGSVTKSTRDVEKLLYEAHSRLPYKVKSMPSTVTFYQKQDGVLGSAGADKIRINMQYITPTTPKNNIRGIYYHELGHVIDYKSFGYSYYTGNLYNKLNQEVGRYNYLEGANYLDKVQSPGYRTKELIPIKPQTNYEFKMDNQKDLVIVFYDGNKKVTRFGYGLYENFKTNIDEKYINLYSVNDNSRLDSLVMRESSDLLSLSRYYTFKPTYLKLGYLESRYDTDKYDAFAQAFAHYRLYRGGYISYSELVNRKADSTLSYFRTVEKNNYQYK